MNTKQQQQQHDVNTWIKSKAQSIYDAMTMQEDKDSRPDNGQGQYSKNRANI